MCRCLHATAQWVSSAVTMPPMEPDDPNTNTSKALNALLPLMIGWFSLNVPSGLALYYFSNTAVTLAQMIYLKKLGGAKVGLACISWNCACTSSHAFL